MTETFGYVCPECLLRYRGSVCKREIIRNTGFLQHQMKSRYRLLCPSGHDLADGFYVYRKANKEGYAIKIEHIESGLVMVSCWVLRDQLDLTIKAELLRADLYFTSFFVQKGIAPPSYNAFVAAIHSLNQSGSISDRDWFSKCQHCKHFMPKYPAPLPPPPANCSAFYRFFKCERGVYWKSITCKFFEYGHTKAWWGGYGPTNKTHRLSPKTQIPVR